MKHMKYMLSISITGLVLLVAVGCTKKQAPAPASSAGAQASMVTKEEYERIRLKVSYLNEQLNELHEYLEKDPRFFLHLMDRDLDAVRQGRKARGSFNDYFVPNAAKALKAGASKRDVTARFDRVIALAKKKIYLSSFVAQLMEEGGPTAVRSYADDWIRRSQQ